MLTSTFLAVIYIFHRLALTLTLLLLIWLVTQLVEFLVQSGADLHAISKSGTFMHNSNHTRATMDGVPHIQPFIHVVNYQQVDPFCSGRRAVVMWRWSGTCSVLIGRAHSSCA
jgi:hypothetical protein